MYISSRKRNKKKRQQKGQFDLSMDERSSEEWAKENILKYEEEEKRERLESPRNMLIEEDHQFEGAILQWQAPEFEMFERDRKWYIYIALILAAIIIYAVFTNSLIMAVLFILIGVVGYIYINKEPRVLNFAITEDGIIAGREIYSFNNLGSFWIFYEPDGQKVVSIRTDSYLNPYIHIPIHNEDPVKIREVLLGYLPEEKEEPGFLEALDRILKL